MEQQLTLYYYPTSFYSQKARLCLEEKGLDYKSYIVDLHGGEATTPAYMKINPKGQVPVLKHGDKYIPDSMKIAEYLETIFRDSRKLIPDTSTKEGSFLNEVGDVCRTVQLDQLTYGAQKYPELIQDCELPALTKIFLKNASNPKNQKKRLQHIQDLADQNPELSDVYLEKKKDVENFLAKLVDKESILEQLEICRQIFDTVEEQLKTNSFAGNAHYWIATPEFMLTDIEVGILMHRLKVVGLAKGTWMDGKHPNVEKYYQRLCARKTFSRLCASIKLTPSTSAILKIVASKIMPAVKVLTIGAAVGGLCYYLSKRYR